MKTSRFFLAATITLMLVVAAGSNSLLASKQTKTFNKEFKVDKHTQLYISNRFGQVVVENWDKNLITIDVEVTVEHSSKERAERMLAAISVTLEQVGDEVRGVTEIDDKLMKSVSNFSFGNSSKELRIDYKIKMPKHLNVTLRNKYGDMFIDELTGLSNIDVKYGNLKANRIVYGNSEPLNLLTLGYGNASIDEVDWMRFDIKYANLDIVKGQALVMLSKYSKISADQVSSLVLESKYDNVNIGSITNLVGESGYTTYRIKRLAKKLNVKTRYGDVRIEEVDNAFESIDFEGGYASIYAPIAESVSYSIDGEASYGGISYGDPARVNRIESNNKLGVNGRVGSNEKSTTSVKIRVKYGSARLK
jgi:hypothetical protein